MWLFSSRCRYKLKKPLLMHITAFNSCKQCALVVFLEEDGPRLVEIFFIQVHHLSQLHLCSIWIHSGVLFESLDKSFGMPNFTEFIDVCKLL